MKAIILALGLLALAACDADDPVSDGANNFSDAEIETLPPDESTAANTGEGFNLTSSEDPDTSAGIPILPEDAARVTIPPEYRGRWGMVAADCTSRRGDAKGLIVIGDRTVRFYESVATLKVQRPSTGTSFAGLFDFTGEGQNWEKVMTITRAGDTLVRAEEGGRYTYRRCA